MTPKMYVALWLIRSTLAVLCFIVTDKPASQPVMSFKSLESMGALWKSPCNPCVYLFRLFSVHMCCAYACISVCCVPARPSWCGGKGYIRVSSSVTSRSTFWDRVSCWTGSLPFQLDELASEPLRSACLYLPPHPCCGMWCPTQHFYTDSRDRNSGSHACVASPLFTESLPQTLGNWKLLFYSHPTQGNTHIQVIFKLLFASRNKSASDLNTLCKAPCSELDTAAPTCSLGSPEVETGRPLLDLGFI